ncbi:RUN domain-containing protein 3B-like isoform X1 [Pomacea canaliculata]|uniref:RUN domain-containing protein 3B-like isoform X1 n=2 Tax=Pomacea canaliculata TaxID=400727 RepID=UPI000D73DB9B|nr:RUN domain-containing protein 3B-like isoform X1 [Pomacea canaliculata]
MESSSNFLANRQLVVVKSNLITVFRYAVKALIDKACFCSIDDGCEEFINFSAAMEQVLQYRLRPSKAWYSIEDRSSFWFYIKAACQGRDMISCINNIDNIENIKSPLAKGHAFLRCALMEKRLADYLSQALKQTTITRRFYQEGAIMLGDEGMELCGVLLGLNAIDFGFCLKGENFDLMPYPLAINYVPFMKFKQSAESLCSDAEEMRELSSCASSIISEDAHDGTPETGQDRYQLLLKRYLCVLEQKSFLEEVAASQEKVLETASIAQQQQLQQQHEMQMQQQQYEAVILELQAQVARMKKVNESLQQQLVLARQTRLPLTELGTTSRSAASSFVAAMEHQQKLNQQSVNSSNSHPRVAQSVDARSMVSAISDLSEMGCMVEAHQEMGERHVDDTQSMVPLVGSLMDLSEPKGDSSSVTLVCKV